MRSFDSVAPGPINLLFLIMPIKLPESHLHHAPNLPLAFLRATTIFIKVKLTIKPNKHGHQA